MNPATLRQEIAIHERLKVQLRTIYGEEIDDQTLMDTLDGETNLVEIVAAIVRQARQDEAMCEAIKAQQDALARRKERYSQRAATLRNVALNAMQETGRQKIEAPDFTVSLAKSPRGVVITDESALPGDCIAWKSSPDKRAIKERLEAGETVPGAELSNGGSGLNVRSS